MHLAYPAALSRWRQKPGGVVRRAPHGPGASFPMPDAKWWSNTSLGLVEFVARPCRRPCQRGPYRWMRHPNYVAVVGELVGAAMMLGTPWTGALACLVFSALMWKRIQVEEKALGRGR